jgi:hypothetical protein
MKEGLTRRRLCSGRGDLVASLLIACVSISSLVTVSVAEISPQPRSECLWPSTKCGENPQWFNYPGFDPSCPWVPPRDPKTVCNINFSLNEYLESCWWGIRVCCETRLEICKLRCGADSICIECCKVKHRSECWLYSDAGEGWSGGGGKYCNVLGKRFCDECPAAQGCGGSPGNESGVVAPGK